jgi:hypothetical protein
MNLDKNDISIVYEIFAEDAYENSYLLEKELSKITDKRIAIGLVVELIRPDMSYNVDTESVKDLMLDLFSKYSKDDDEDLSDIHEYYVNKISTDVRSIMYDFFGSIEGDITENEDFSNWLISLSDDDVQVLEEHCIKVELYEVITFMRSLRVK